MYNGKLIGIRLKEWINPQTVTKVFIVYLAIGFIVYFVSLFGEFLWDDNFQLIRMPDTYALSNIPQIFLKGQLNIFYKPVFFSYLTFIHSVFGLNPFFFHFFQIFIHIINAVFVYVLFKKILPGAIPFILGLTFLVHPMNVEAVAYISAACGILFLFFGFLGYFILAQKEVSLFHLVFSFAFLLLSLLSKEAGILMVGIIPVYFLLYKRKRFISAFFVSFLALFSYVFLRFYVAHTIYLKPTYVPIAIAAFEDRVRTIFKIIFVYVTTFFFPYKLSIGQNWVVKENSLSDFFLPLVFDLIFFFTLFRIGVYLYKKKNLFRAYIFFLIWFLLGLTLYLHIIPIDVTVAERWFYFPMIGLLGICGVIYQNIHTVFSKKRKSIIIVASIVLFLLSGRTIIRTFDWLSAYNLFGHDIRITKDSYEIESNYGYELLLKRKYEDALVHAKNAIRLSPNYIGGWVVMGGIYLEKKEYSKALYYYKKAYVYDKQDYAVFYGLSFSSLKLGDAVSTIKWADEGLKFFPKDNYLLNFKEIAKKNLGNE